MAERIPDEALVVRGGTCSPEKLDSALRKRHPSGVVGASVQSAADVPVEELARKIRNNQIGVTTAGEIRTAGGDVVRTSGGGYHATVTGISAHALSRLLCPTRPNPTKPEEGG
jgi:hypothetical protein